MPSSKLTTLQAWQLNSNDSDSRTGGTIVGKKNQIRFSLRIGMFCRFFEEAFQDARAAMVLVMCRVDKREYSFLTFLMQEINRLVLRLEFRSITLLELGPFFDVGVLTETLVQLSARGDLLKPLVELSVALSQITGPKWFDKNSETVVGGRVFVGTFKLDHARSPLLECLSIDWV